MRATECRLPCDELVLLGSSYVTLVACEFSQHLFCTVGHLWDRFSDDVQTRDIRQRGVDDGAYVYNSLCTGLVTYERIESGIHFESLSSLRGFTRIRLQ